MRTALLSALLVACSCESCTHIRASDFDQSCETADDCEAVFTGDSCDKRCGDCDCPNDAINKDALDEYEAATDRLVCPPRADFGMCAVCDCGVGPLECTDGVCRMGAL